MSFSNSAVPSLADYAVFLSSIGIRDSYLPVDSPWREISFNIALETVNDTLQVASPTLYTLAVYNLAVDRLINFAPDVSGETFFQDKRSDYGVYSFVPGVVQGAGDQGTSSSLVNIDAMKGLTLADLQTLKTPYGRQYMGIAQKYGTTIWGLS